LNILFVATNTDIGFIKNESVIIVFHQIKYLILQHNFQQKKQQIILLLLQLKVTTALPTSGVLGNEIVEEKQYIFSNETEENLAYDTETCYVFIC